MDKSLIYCAGKTPAAKYAAENLRSGQFPVTDMPSQQVGHLLLDVPSFEAGGNLRMGGAVEALLRQLDPGVTVYGGNLAHPALKGYRCVDFLRDNDYLARNAYITAECALDVAYPYLNITLRGCPVLIIGWGRIGKCLGQLLQRMGSDVTVAARKPADRSMLRALGYRAVDTARLTSSLPRFRLIFNTAPELILNRDDMAACRDECVKIELASKDGMEGDDVIIARGLPGIHMPESSGDLIAETFLRFYKEEMQ